MTANFSRRSALTVIAAAGAAPASAAAAACMDASVLRELWAEYERNEREAEALSAIHGTFRPDRDRDDWREEIDRLQADPTSDFNRTARAWNAAVQKNAPIIRAIHTTEARTFFDIGAKLAALPPADDDDFKCAAIAVMRDIDLMLGTSFAPRWDEHYTAAILTWGLNEDED